ncbi:MAG: hypothetical protein AAGN35_23400 [Bacteroidota bacterium]
MPRSVYHFVLILIAGLSLAFTRIGNTPDLSTPQTSYAAFVDALKSSNTDHLQRVATPTGMTSLMVLAEKGDFTAGLSGLAADLEGSHLEFAEITEDIYFVSAQAGESTHKMEFTREEPGWMLYHWQVGGGTQSHE